MKDGAKENTPAAQDFDPAMAQKVNQPIDTTATYMIPGGVLAQLYAELDEVPMKYARRCFPLIAMNIERVEPKQD